ncbi:MAG: hypothetical protein GY754_46730 [bacterium]|nr:hypothetical protein [bacterium]
MASPFKELPDNFFSPLAFSSREHYGALLLVFYNLFLEFPTGVERNVVVSKYEEYFSDLANLNEIITEDERDEEEESGYEKNPRGLANRFLRRLIACGWMSEETLADYTEIVNITSFAKPFYEALALVSEGTAVEYESHVVGIYSSLCSVSVEDNGHHAVLNAHYHTRLLIESLKVLSQNIKTHIQNIYRHEANVKDILHFHYDIYMNEIVDKAYNRLKTSDNLSRYRPDIIHAINELLKNEAWLSKTSEKLSLIKLLPREQTNTILVSMLKDIKGDLKSIDPILEEIDDKNRRYSKISTQMIKKKLYSDASLEGKIQNIAAAIKNDELDHERLMHHIQRTRFFRRDSLYSRTRSKATAALVKPKEIDTVDLEFAETELKLRIQKQLNPEKILRFLDSKSIEGAAFAADMVEDMDSFVRVMYAALYAESRDFGYRVHWENEEIIVGRFRFKKHRFIRVFGSAQTPDGREKNRSETK